MKAELLEWMSGPSHKLPSTTERSGGVAVGGGAYGGLMEENTAETEERENRTDAEGRTGNK